MKLYKPNNFKCPVTQQNWFPMVTEHTIHPNNFKVASHIPTTLFSQIPSALSVVWNFSTPCYRKDFFSTPICPRLLLSLSDLWVRSRTWGSCPSFVEAGGARIPLQVGQHPHRPLFHSRQLLRSWGSTRQKLPFVLVSGPGRTFSSCLFSFLSFTLLPPRMAGGGTTMGKMEQPLLHAVTPAPQQHSAEAEGHGAQAAPGICLSSSAEEEAKSLHQFQPLSSSSCHCWWSCCCCQERDPVGWRGANRSAAFDWFWSPSFFLFCPCSPLAVAWMKRDFYNHRVSDAVVVFFPFVLCPSHGQEKGLVHQLVFVPWTTWSSMEANFLGEGFLCHLVCFVPGQSMGFSTFISSDDYWCPSCCCFIF